MVKVINGLRWVESKPAEYVEDLAELEGEPDAECACGCGGMVAATEPYWYCEAYGEVVFPDHEIPALD
jgi:hypothetical protein